MFEYKVPKLLKISETEMSNTDTRKNNKPFTDLVNGCKYFAKFLRIFSQLYGTVYVNLSLNKIFLLFHIFQVDWKTREVIFFVICSINSDFLADYDKGNGDT